MTASHTIRSPEPWNKGKLVGQKAPLNVRDIWAIRVRLQLQGRFRDLALLNLGIDSHAGVISSNFVSATCVTATGLAREPS